VNNVRGGTSRIGFHGRFSMEEFFAGEDDLYKGGLDIPTLFKKRSEIKFKNKQVFQVKVRSNIKNKNQQKLLRI